LGGHSRDTWAPIPDTWALIPEHLGTGPRSAKTISFGESAPALAGVERRADTPSRRPACLAARDTWGAGRGDGRLPRDPGGVAALLPGVERLSTMRPRRFPSGMGAAQHALGTRNDVVAERPLREEAFNYFVFSDVKHVMLVCREYETAITAGGRHRRCMRSRSRTRNYRPRHAPMATWSRCPCSVASSTTTDWRPRRLGTSSIHRCSGRSGQVCALRRRPHADTSQSATWGTRKRSSSGLTGADPLLEAAHTDNRGPRGTSGCRGPSVPHLAVHASLSVR
jgi:hypothetical protein